jgi:alpha-D-ribose 1-methylphosphonate 5-triphosphate synthase subunit PhnG
MFHAFDKPAPGVPLGRPDWMALLSRAPLPLLQHALAPHRSPGNTQWLRRPETGLYMVQGRAGGTGARFNLGELTVTRCALRQRHTATGTETVGVAYVLGRHHEQAELAALADALLQTPTGRDALTPTLLDPVREHLARSAAERSARAQSTKVDFLTVAREASGTDELDGEDA